MITTDRRTTDRRTVDLRLVWLGMLVACRCRARLSAQTSLTIYNDGRVLVRRTLPVAVPKGNSHPARGARRARPGVGLLARPAA